MQSVKRSTNLVSNNEKDQISDLLKLTDKIGVSSTRHDNHDYLSKLQNGNKSKDQSIFTYKPLSP